MLLILIDRVFNNIELCYAYPFVFCIFLIGTRIQSQLLFLMENLFFIQITVSQKKFCLKTQFKILYRSLIFKVTIMSQILIKV